jgi:hypothetical protein
MRNVDKVDMRAGRTDDFGKRENRGKVETVEVIEGSGGLLESETTEETREFRESARNRDD